MNKEQHLSDEELLLAADGDLATHQAATAVAHLETCGACRSRMAEIEETVADFTRAHRRVLDPQLLAIAGARARLRAELTRSTSSPARAWHRLFQLPSSMSAAACIAAVLIIAAVAGRLLLEHPRLGGTNSKITSAEGGAKPDPELTPGATRRVAINDVCSAPRERVVAEVSASLRQKVFREYGILSANPGDYELDYLIAPGLGGVEDIHNLWPQPYTARIWNAHVKDELEERLHEMVCAGQLDLSTAQRDIASDWIAAYKKYFQTDQPLALRSRLESPWEYDVGHREGPQIR